MGKLSWLIDADPTMRRKAVLMLCAGFAFIFPVLWDFQTLPRREELALGIYLMAAVLFLTRTFADHVNGLVIVLIAAVFISEVSLFAPRGNSKLEIEQILEPEYLLVGAEREWNALAIPSEAVRADDSVILAETKDGPFRNVSLKEIIPNRFDSPEASYLTRPFFPVEPGTLEVGDMVVMHPEKHWTLPGVSFPLQHILGALASPPVFLYLAMVSLAAASIYSGMHLRVAAFFLGKVKPARPARVIFAVIFLSALFSAFMDNVATAGLILSILWPSIQKLDAADPLRRSLLLAAFGGIVLGGLITPLGGVSNLLIYGIFYEAGLNVTFRDWVLAMAPLVFTMLLIMGAYLVKNYRPLAETVNFDFPAVPDKHDGKAMTVLVVAIGTVALWMTDILPAWVVALLPMIIFRALHIFPRFQTLVYTWERLWFLMGGMLIALLLLKTNLGEFLASPMIETQFTMPLLVWIVFFGLLAFTTGLLLAHRVLVLILIPLLCSIALGFYAQALDTERAVHGETRITVLIFTMLTLWASGLLVSRESPVARLFRGGAILRTRDLWSYGAVCASLATGMSLILAFTLWPLIF